MIFSRVGSIVHQEKIDAVGHSSAYKPRKISDNGMKISEKETRKDQTGGM